MSTEVKALAVGLPTEIPKESIDYLIDILLTRGRSFDRLKAVKAAYAVVGYILGRFFADIATADSVVSSKRVSKKQIAEALKALADSTGNEFTAESFPDWLVPILLELVRTWLQNRRK